MARDYNWTWLAGLIISAVLSWLVWSYGLASLPEDNSRIYYLLSGLGQALAAIFALVFTISLVAAQLTVRYTYRLLQRTFPWWIILYTALFALAILYPFFLLGRDSTLLEVRISLCAAVVCVILILPYFITFPRRLGVSQIIDYLARQANRHSSSGEFVYACEDRRAIENIAMSALAYHDYDTFDLATRSLVKAAVNPSNQIVEAYHVSEQLKDIASRVLSDSQAVRSAIDALNVIGVTAVRAQIKIDKRWVDVPDIHAILHVASALAELGQEAAKQESTALVQ